MVPPLFGPWWCDNLMGKVFQGDPQLKGWTPGSFPMYPGEYRVRHRISPFCRALCRVPGLPDQSNMTPLFCSQVN